MRPLRDDLTGSSPSSWEVDATDIAVLQDKELRPREVKGHLFVTSLCPALWPPHPDLLQLRG